MDRDYALGTIQTWNATISRDIGKDWTSMAAYTGTKGTNLDILRAPNRGPDGLLIPGVQAFTWESSGGHSILNAANFQVRRRLAGGFSGDLSYTLAKSMDNASSLGAGAPVVAQNDKDLAVRMGALELRPPAPAVGRFRRSSCRSARTAAGSRTAGCSPTSSATGPPRWR